MYYKVHHFIHTNTTFSTGGRGPPLQHLPHLVTCAYNDFTPSYAPECIRLHLWVYRTYTSPCFGAIVISIGFTELHWWQGKSVLLFYTERHWWQGKLVLLFYTQRHWWQGKLVLLFYTQRHWWQGKLVLLF